MTAIVIYSFMCNCNRLVEILRVLVSDSFSTISSIFTSSKLTRSNIILALGNVPITLNLLKTRINKILISLVQKPATKFFNRNCSVPITITTNKHHNCMFKNSVNMWHFVTLECVYVNVNHFDSEIALTEHINLANDLYRANLLRIMAVILKTC